MLTEYCDGIHFREHPVFSADPNALRLHFYEDEFEVVNPLGSKKNKHKLCAIYYTVGNVHSRYRSQLKHIHLALLVRYKCVQQCGLDSILQPMLKDLQELTSNGVTVTVNGIDYKIQVAIATISGDYLSAHLIGGFTMSFSTGCIGRQCMATYGDIKEKFSEDQFQLRTSEVHKYHLQSMRENPENSAIYGVRSRCPFEELNYFDTTTAFPPDLMHDFLEGVIPLVLKLVLTKAHRERHITLHELSEEIKKNTYWSK
ncbi:hypothetical protein HHUSO_G15940 [Huso huso]|uniref:Uncharacterized protein n=1 Tax=Huso huso TaxID=61971 RepID=A0ABR0ZDF2_HUSHU